MAFQATSGAVDLPPAFYPRQPIPTLLTLELARNSHLAHALRPQLTMSMVGTLRLGAAPPQTIIYVSVSLEQGLALWARDAAVAHAAEGDANESDPTTMQRMPGGTYTLPLSVQVPATPRLPPSFAVPGAHFAVSYALEVALTVDAGAAGGRVVLAHAARSFDMLPETLPTPPPAEVCHALWVPGAVGDGAAAARWRLTPSLPTSTYSPTSSIPLQLRIEPPPEGSARRALVRVSLVRRERSDAQRATIDVSSAWGWVRPAAGTATTVRYALPIMTAATWAHGFSTVLNVDAAHGSGGGMTVIVSSTFHLLVQAVFLADDEALGAWFEELGEQPFESGQFSRARAGAADDKAAWDALVARHSAAQRTLSLPVILGSVSEPRGALHAYHWSDLLLGADGSAGRMVEGEAFSSEDGWMCAPPTYSQALDDIPYVY
ncbi:uncharacterized protein LOC62_06G008254 [Vanrija pseudolonga]|uniref:Uncharacterized protein n=1 Tax=Vanrija pseudolonga TaxID=143232 RepID=A0AAF0YHC8_9TREE|nr:hypothetical protein LOC62_06G008254 [Vanrija pseudolonga]